MKEETKYYKFVTVVDPEMTIDEEGPKFGRIYPGNHRFGPTDVEEYARLPDTRIDWEQVSEEEYHIQEGIVNKDAVVQIAPPQFSGRVYGTGPAHERFENDPNFEEKISMNERIILQQKEAIDLIRSKQEQETSEQQFLDFTAQMWIANQEYPTQFDSGSMTVHYKSRARHAYNFAEALFNERKRRFFSFKQNQFI